MDAVHFLLVCVAGWMNGNPQHVIEYLMEEVRVLKEHLGLKRLLFTDDQRGRLAKKAKKIRFGKLKDIAGIVTPQTLLAWHCRLIAKKYDSSSSKRIGRPRIRESITELIVRLAKENRTWGYSSIDGALLNLGHDVGRSTIARVLKKAGIAPVPQRKKGGSEFLKRHWNLLAATDFFTAEVWTVRGLIRYHVLFVIRLATREVKIVGIIPEPNDPWMKQIARNRPCFSNSFRQNLQQGGVKPIRLPRKSPNLNSIAERWVRTAKELCFHRMIFFGEGTLRHALAETEIFYNRERPHQALENTIMRPKFASATTGGAIVRRRRLGGMLNFYFREAA